MSKEAEVSVVKSGEYTLVVPIPVEIRKDSTYEAVGIGDKDRVKVEIFGSSLRITKVDSEKK